MENKPTSSIVNYVLKSLEEKKPKFRIAHDALVFAMHLTMTQMGFQCIGTAEKEDPSAVITADNWNSMNFEHYYSFRYSHSKGSTYIVKYYSAGERLLVNGAPPQCQLEIENVKEFVNDKLQDYENLFKNLENLITMFKVQIIAQFIPFIEEKKTQETKRSPLLEDPPRSQYQHPYGYAYPQSNPYFGIGGDDLFPSSNYPGFGPFPGNTPGGNLIGPNHPGFGPINDPFRGSGPFPSPNAPRPPGVPPPGARFDPFGPPGTNFPFGPDADHLPPPGGPKGPFGGGFGGFGGGII